MSATTRPRAQSPRRAVTRRWRRYLADELLEADVYRHLATRRVGEEREILLALAEAEGRHADHWRALLAAAGADGVRGRPSAGSRLLAALARRFGSVFVLALAQQAEGRSTYREDDDATAAMAADERVHEEVVRALAARGRARVSGVFRAAVFGANDGLVSNLSLVLGVVGGGVGTHVILLTGVSGLLAGALSMGAGEFVSVSSQRELLEASSPSKDTHEVIGHLDVDANELALVYRARGMEPEEASAHAQAQLFGRRSPADPGITPGGVDGGGGAGAGAGGDAAEVVGSGLSAAASSASFFASGALIPVLPFLVGLSGPVAVAIAVVLVAIALMATGAVVGVLSGSGLLVRGLRQLAVGLGAAAVTYVLGLAFGAALG